ncbi:MAG: Ig-like domain-containing protein [Actinobacteria bacterium]|nr:Ig-like domain-containing protein [Actinomycetota bacterium]
MHGLARVGLSVAVAATGVAAAPRILPALANAAHSVGAYSIVSAPYGTNTAVAPGIAGLLSTSAIINARGDALAPAPTVTPDALAYGTRSLAASADASDPLTVVYVGDVSPPARHTVAPVSPAAPVDSTALDTSDSNISVTIPPVSFGATDGLPATLQRGQSYTVTFPVIGADRTVMQSASIIGRGLVLDPACSNYPLLPGAVTYVTCTVTVRANALGAQVRGSANGIGSRIVRHAVDSASRATAIVTATPSATTVGYGAPRSLVVDVTAPGYTPTGTVTITVDGSTVLPAARLASGSVAVALPANLSLGTHSLVAKYNGDSWVSSVTVATTSVTVVKAQAIIDASSELGFTGVLITVAVGAQGISTVTGTVTVSEASTTLTSAPLSSGVAKLGLPPTLTSGNHTLTVTYGGSSTVAPTTTQLIVAIP